MRCVTGNRPASHRCAPTYHRARVAGDGRGWHLRPSGHQDSVAGGFNDPSSQSAKASALLVDKFHQSDTDLIITVTSEGGVHSAAAQAVAGQVVAVLKESPYVADLSSAWTAPPATANALVSTDSKTGLVVAGITGGENEYPKHARELADQLPSDRDGVTVRAGGALTYAEVNEQSERDLLLMESIAIPLSFVVLVWVFGGLLAAALPMVVGVFAILGSLAVLRAVTFVADVSIFAMNLTAAMGLALAVDYTLLIISRFRDELASGADRDEALVRTMTTAGRTVLFSAMTVALSMGAMVLFPMYFLKSFAYAGTAVVAFAALAAVVIAPAAIVLLGTRLDAFDVRRLGRRLLGRAEPQAAGPKIPSGTASQVSHAALDTDRLAIVATLLLLGAPFLGVRWGFADDRVLPTTASSRQVGDDMREKFATDSATNLTVVVPDAIGLDPEELGRYAMRLSDVPDVSSVSAPVGTFVNGVLAGPPSAPTAITADSAFLTLGSRAPLFSDASDIQLNRLHEVTGPAGKPVLWTGLAQINRDSVDAITKRLPIVLAVIAAITLIVLFLLTGSVVLPVKALLMNVLSLTAAFGALVWIFQDGHLGGLGTSTTGTLVANVPVLMFCIAFGLSMDYEVFLLSRIREYWLASGRTRADNDESVALGLARTGRVVTAAALLMSISFAALITAKVAFMKMFGVGLTIAVLVDATLVRMLLLPAFMHVLGRANWWAPKPLVRLHDRIGINESGSDPVPRAGEDNDYVGAGRAAAPA